ncbi:MAG: phage late control D family protein [Proteobacteria bacterium]|nr:phage late control D family protein [Pseudomonadota bacterium]
MPYRAPAYRILVDGLDITPAIRPRLESLSLIDNRGFEADTLDIVLDDTDGLLGLPPRGARVAVALGWEGEPLEDKGEYIVDELEHAGTPDRLTIRARSADLRSGIATKKERSWHGVTLGDLVRSIAAQNKLTPIVGKQYADLPLDHLDQTAESDANLLQRMAEEHGAIATVKAGRLLFIAAGQATTASGAPLPVLTITRNAGDQHRFSVADRAAYTAVRANYNDPKLAQRAYVQVGEETISGEDDPTTTEPSAGNIKTLRHTYANKTNAERAVTAEWHRIQRGMANFTLTLAYGRAELFPEVPVTVAGWKPEIDSQGWLAVRVRHDVSSSGFTTTVEMEKKPLD